MVPSFHRFALGLLGFVVAGAAVAAGFVQYGGAPEHTVVAVPAARPAPPPSLASAGVSRPPEPQPGPPRLAPDLDAIAAGAPVPRRTGWSPDELASPTSGEGSKQEFIELVLPLALLANEEVLGQRMRLWDVLQRSNAGGLTSEDRLWLAYISASYEVQEGDLPELARRLDIVPPSILVAVAAGATGWNAGNGAGWRSLFRSAAAAPRKAVGLRPQSEERPSPLDALRLYTKMVNTHPDFLSFRLARERLRRSSTPLHGSALTATLPRVSPGRLPGAVAVFDLVSTQRLERFDFAELEPRSAPAPGFR